MGLSFYQAFRDTEDRTTKYKIKDVNERFNVKLKISMQQISIRHMLNYISNYSPVNVAQTFRLKKIVFWLYILRSPSMCALRRLILWFPITVNNHELKSKLLILLQTPTRFTFVSSNSELNARKKCLFIWKNIYKIQAPTFIMTYFMDTIKNWVKLLYWSIK